MPWDGDTPSQILPHLVPCRFHTGTHYWFLFRSVVQWHISIIPQSWKPQGACLIGARVHHSASIKTRKKGIFFATRLVTRVYRIKGIENRKIWKKGIKFTDPADNPWRVGNLGVIPGAHAWCSVQRAVGTVASFSFRVLFRNWLTRMMYRPQWDMPPPPPPSGWKQKSSTTTLYVLLCGSFITFWDNSPSLNWGRPVQERLISGRAGEYSYFDAFSPVHIL